MQILLFIFLVQAAIQQETEIEPKCNRELMESYDLMG